MDPDALLANIRASMITFWEMIDKDEDVTAIAEDIVSMIENLDTWLSFGGFIPNDWRDTGLMPVA